MQNPRDPGLTARANSYRPAGWSFWSLDLCDLDVVAAPLARSALENGVGFGYLSGGPSPLLYSQLVVNR
jgi:hypothetical protein